MLIPKYEPKLFSNCVWNGGYILDQGRALRQSFAERACFVDPMIELFQNQDIRKVYFLGSGTSYHAALSFKNWFEKYLKVEAEVVIPTVFTNYTQINNNAIYQPRQILVVGISQSGTSVSTVEAMRKAKNADYFTVALTEALSSLITREVDVVVPLTCGKEEIPIETRGYIITLLTGYLWAIEIASALGQLEKAQSEQKLQEAETMLEYFDALIEEVQQWIDRNQPELLDMKKGHIAAYGTNYPTALEGVLKMYETFHKPLSAYELEELIHGPQMAFDDQTYLYFIASNEVERTRIPLFLDWIRENEVTEHVFVFYADQQATNPKDLHFRSPIAPDLSPLAFVVPFQLMAARNCEAIGYDTSVYPPKRRAFAHKKPEEQA